MALNLDQSAFMESLVKEVKEQQNEVIEKMLGVAIQKGIIQVRQSDPVLAWEPKEEKVRLLHSAVIDYTGAEKIEELEKALEYMKKINSELHQALEDFYNRTKENVWLKSQK